MKTEQVLIVYLIAVNILAFILYGIDKRRARNRKWRIREKTLIGIAAAGGSVGAILGMHAFHHKTRRASFRYGLPMILLIQGMVIFLILPFLKK